MKYSFFKIFTKPFYLTSAAIAVFFVFSLLSILPNISFIKDILLSPSINTASVIEIIFRIIWGTAANFTSASMLYMVLLSFLIGINVSLLIFYVRLRRVFFGAKKGVVGVLGFLSGVIGLGCASCGSILLTSFLPIFGLGWLVAFLPLHGAEFSILSIILLVWSAKVIFRGINTPMVCTSKFKKK